MTFLPEGEEEFLKSKGFAYEQVEEDAPGAAARHGLILHGFSFEGNLRSHASTEVCTACDLLIIIPPGFATTKLDSFYTSPRLLTHLGSDPVCATGTQELFGRAWQFWSRHLEPADWRVGIDGLETYLQYIRAELKKA